MQVDDCCFRDDRVRGHSSQPKGSIERAAIVMEAIIRNGSAIFADIFFSQPTLKALAAGNRPVQHDAISHGKTSDIVSDRGHNAGTFVPQDQALLPLQGIPIRMADSACFDGYHQFASSGGVHHNAFD